MRITALLALPLAVWGGLVLLPLLWLLRLSLSEKSGIAGQVFTATLDNYARSFDPIYLRVFGYSLAQATLTTALCFILALPLAIFVAFCAPRLRAWLFLLMVLPFFVNSLVRCVALIFILRRRGLLGSWWEASATTVGSWLHRLGVLDSFDPLFYPPLLFSHFSVTLGLVYINLPFMMLPLYAAFMRLDRAVLEASVDLGAGRWATFRYVMLPLARPGIWAGCFLTFVPALGAYLVPALLGGTSTAMIGTVIERQFKLANDWPFGAALSMLLLGFGVFCAVCAGGTQRDITARRDMKRRRSRLITVQA